MIVALLSFAKIYHSRSRPCLVHSGLWPWLPPTLPLSSLLRQRTKWPWLLLRSVIKWKTQMTLHKKFHKKRCIRYVCIVWLYVCIRATPSGLLPLKESSASRGWTDSQVPRPRVKIWTPGVGSLLWLPPSKRPSWGGNKKECFWVRLYTLAWYPHSEQAHCVVLRQCVAVLSKIMDQAAGQVGYNLSNAIPEHSMIRPRLQPKKMCAQRRKNWYKWCSLFFVR